LRSIPVPHPEELFSINSKVLKSEFPVESYPNYLDTRDRIGAAATGLAAYRIDGMNFSRGGDNSRVWGYLVTGNYFDMLGIHPLRGRVLHPDDDRMRSASPVAVITYAFWQRRFGGAADALGAVVKLNGLDYTIVGITPQGFQGTELIYTPEIFVPMSMEPQIEPGQSDLDVRGNFNYFVVGRVRPGATLAQVNVLLAGISDQLAREYPNDNAGMNIYASPAGLFGNMFRGTIRTFAAVLSAVAGLVLLIACVNLASLLLARAADRRKDTAVRLALGASRSHLIRQLMTESLVLSILGGAAGLLLAQWMVSLFAAWKPPVDVPVIPAFSIDLRVMLFAGGVSIVTGILFGLAPALQSASPQLAPALKNEAVAERLRKFQMRDVLIAAQVALSVLLLVGSVLVVRSLQNALTVPLGFDPQHVAMVQFDLGLQGYDETRGRDFEKRILERVKSLPGAESAAIIDSVPLTLNWSNSGIVIEGKPVPRAADTPLAARHHVTPGYFKTAHTRLIAGRDFDERDKKGATETAVVNEAFVKQLLPGENPIGKRFAHNARGGRYRTIIGVVEDGKYRSLGEAPMPAVFESIDQEYSSNPTIVVRSPMPEDQMTSMLRATVREMDSTITLTTAGSWTSQLGLALFPARISAIVLGAFGLLAVVLAATGVYGITAYAVARRTREIGIRMALGAKPREVVGVVMSHTALLLGAGAVIGLALAYFGTHAMSSILYGVSPNDPLTYSTAIGIMALVGMAACWFPVRRAMRVDPVRALRTE
jgi:predicted permease